jgi:hypothetical protein
MEVVGKARFCELPCATGQQSTSEIQQMVNESGVQFWRCLDNLALDLAPTEGTMPPLGKLNINGGRQPSIQTSS